MDKVSPMAIVPTLLQVEMLEMWIISVLMFMPAMLVLVLMGMLVLLSMLVSGIDIVALGRIDIPDILILIDPPSI